MNKFYIYFHYTADTNELFYVGKGCNNRSFVKKGRNKYWLGTVEKHGIIVKIIKNLLSEPLAFAYEKYYIKKYKPKCNFTKGGEGGNTTAFYNEEQKSKYKDKCSKKKKDWWEGKDLATRKKLLAPTALAVSNMWNNMDPEIKSAEQKRRNSFKTIKKVKCLNNNIIYNSAVEAANALNIKKSDWVRRVAKGVRPHVCNYKFEYVT